MKMIKNLTGEKLDDNVMFIKAKESNCKKCIYYHSQSDNVCISNCERLNLKGYYQLKTKTTK